MRKGDYNNKEGGGEKPPGNNRIGFALGLAWKGVQMIEGGESGKEGLAQISACHAAVVMEGEVFAQSLRDQLAGVEQ